MSTNFIHENFLLENKYAEEVYHKYSKNQPIIDYHNHLSPKLIAEDNVFKNITIYMIFCLRYCLNRFVLIFLNSMV